MAKKVRVTKPVSTNFPTWFHRDGYKMRLEKFDEKSRFIEITNGPAKVTIKRIDHNGDNWLVSCEIFHDEPKGSVHGCRWFSDEHLAAAFGLTKPEKKSRRLLKRFGGDSVSQGRFIRQGNCLNIPCPGTGKDGDPNVSIEICCKMRDAVQKLLRQNNV